MSDKINLGMKDLPDNYQMTMDFWQGDGEDGEEYHQRILETIPIAEIEKFLRKKKLENINEQEN